MPGVADERMGMRAEEELMKSEQGAEYVSAFRNLVIDTIPNAAIRAGK